jgi:hypothetical protein
MRRLTACAAAALCLALGVALPRPARAQGQPAGVTVVHRETVRVGPYRVAVGFSRWPVRAERSLDIVFMPDGGIAGKHGTVTLTPPSGGEKELPLVRHPRMRTVWGLDVIALPEQGRWTARFEIDGPLGRGDGRLPVVLLPRPGPPVVLGWLPVLLASGGLLAAILFAWWQVRPVRRSETWSWT